MGQKVSQYTLILNVNDYYYKVLLNMYNKLDKSFIINSYIEYCELGLKFNNCYKVFFDNDYYKKHNNIKIYHSDTMIDPSVLHKIINFYLINDLVNIVEKYCYDVITGYDTLFASDYTSEITPFNMMLKSNIFRYLAEVLKDFKLSDDIDSYYLFDQLNEYRLGRRVNKYCKLINMDKYEILFDDGSCIKNGIFRPLIYSTIYDFHNYRRLYNLSQ
jgi:hypothetical protein